MYNTVPGTYAAPVLPIEYIGPAPLGSNLGSDQINGDPGGYTKIEGETIKPSPMVPPEVDITEPRMIRLAHYLSSELWACESERWEHIDRLDRLKQKYRTKFPTLPKNFPIPNSSQITIPVIKTNVDALTSRLYQTVMAADPLASVRTKDPAYSDFANDWELFLKQYSEEKLQMDEVLDTALTESIKLGTSVIETTRCIDKRKVVKFDSASMKYIQSTEEVYNGPIIYNIPLEDFWIRPEHQDIQKAPWCGKVIRVTWSEIKDMALSGELNPEKIDMIWRLPISGGSDIPKTIEGDNKQEQTPPTAWTRYRLFELCVRWDVDGDGIDEELIVYFHLESNTVLRVKFNTFKKGRRPWRAFRYKRIEYRFYGEGMAELLEHLQEEISTQHNQRLDNATIASLKLILTGRSVPGLRPGDPLWPGKIIKADPKTVDVFTLGEIYPSTVTNEQLALNYVRDATGIGEAALGNAQPVSRTTAAAQLSLLEELNRRFDKTLKAYRKVIGQVYCDITDMFAETGTGGLSANWFGDVRGQMIEQFLTQNGLYDKVKIQVTSTKATINREVEMQTNIALMNLIIQNGQQLMALVQQLAPQALPVVANLLLESIRPIYKKVLQYADAPNADEAIRVLAFVESILPSPEDMGGMAKQGALPGATPPGPVVGGGAGANGNGAGAPSGNAGDPRMGDIMQSLGQIAGRLPPASGRRNGR